MPPRGTIFLVGGMNDVWLVRLGWDRGLRLAHLPHRIRHFRWQQGLESMLTFSDLWRVSHHHASADRLARLIRAELRDKPGEPVHVMAHSAGTAITAYALERVDELEAITSAVFVGSALSPEYDLTRSLSRCTAGILAVESRFDWLHLGIGTSVLGTCDRHRSPAAGMVGFSRAYDKLKVVRWRPHHIRQGWFGGHLSEVSPWFVRRTLAAWIRQAEGLTVDG